MKPEIAPTYVTLNLVHLEENLYELSGKKYNKRYKNIIY